LARDERKGSRLIETIVTVICIGTTLVVLPIALVHDYLDQHRNKET